MISTKEIYETQTMILEQNLDVRTITMGINLMDCADESVDAFNEKIYTKITQRAKDLVTVCDTIAREYGIPIVNKRISITPIAIAASACRTDSYVSIAQTLDRAAKEVGVDFIGGFSALVEKGITPSDQILINSVPEALAVTDRVCSSINIGSTRAGINMDALLQMGNLIVKTAELTADRDSIGCAKFVVFCNSVEDNPFMAGAYHGVGLADTVINVGVSGPGVVKKALENEDISSFENLCETIKKTAFKITRAGQLIAQEASRRLGYPFGTIDLSLAPTPAIGDSIGEIFQVMGLEQPGAHGTTLALALLNDNIKKGGVMASSHVGGLSGAFIPVSEDHAMITAVEKGALTLDKLEAMSAVCSVGIDMAAVPGKTTANQLSGIIGDECAIGFINNKTTAVRIIPVIGKDVGESVVFGGLLGHAPIMPINDFNNDAFVLRGGHIPAPIHSFKN
ncbi:PFL family protein [Erysipelothrix anatis]|uniref:PFL family protein n=1 Tax=Erysipelothrix anatis TaxID=2683713 RepID=UPI0013590080|nr:PFL family protein [Erysipelothrix anatis]